MRLRTDKADLRRLADQSTEIDRLRRLVDLVREGFPTRGDEKAKLRAFLGGLVPEGQKGQPLDERETLALHKELGEALRGLVANPPRQWPLPTAYTYVTRRLPGAPIELRSEGRTIDGVRSGVVNLLLAAGENLLACAECGAPFVRERRQEYCSERCSQRVRNRRRRG
jgi:hypothetical protein